jgi:hypothetical protein
MNPGVSPKYVTAACQPPTVREYWEVTREIPLGAGAPVVNTPAGLTVPPPVKYAISVSPG